MSNLKYFLQYSLFRDIWTVFMPSLVLYATSKLFNHPFSEEATIGVSFILLIMAIVEKYSERHERFAKYSIRDNDSVVNNVSFDNSDKFIFKLLTGTFAIATMFTFGVWLPVRYIFETTLYHNLSMLTLLLLSIAATYNELHDYFIKGIDF